MESFTRLFDMPFRSTARPHPVVPAEVAPPLAHVLGPAPRPFQETEPAVMPYVPTAFDIPL